MSGRWWRAYGRARHDPKLLKLSDKHHRWWFDLVCVASDNGGTLPSHADLAAEFRVTGKAMTEILDALIAGGLFDHDETGIRPHNWDGLQFLSDNGAERVRRHRAKRAAAGLLAQWQPTKELRKAIYERDGHECVYCGSPDDLTIDHRTPEIRGGSNEIENLQTTCRVCNASKRDMTHEEYVTRPANVTLQKRPQRSETENRTDSVPNGTGADAPQDPVKELFDDGVKLLTENGCKPGNARSLIGKWRKEQGDEATQAAFKAARAEGVTEPIAWITQRFAGKPRESWNERRIRLGMEAISDDRH